MNKQLFLAAKAASVNSYAIFSHFTVSAALLLNDGRIYTGVNIENSSYPLSMCAERVCIFKAYSEGVRKDDIKSILIYHPGDKIIPYPCGACRQVMSDLLKGDAIVTVANDSKFENYTVSSLLPNSFSKEALE